MTDENGRDPPIDLSFLGEGTYEAVIFQDAFNSDRWAEGYEKVTKTVTSTDKLTASLHGPGRSTARLIPMI